MREKVCKRRLAHFASSHPEVPMMDCPKSSSMSIDPDVERRVGENHGGSFPPHQNRVACRVKTISAKDTMASKEPKIAGLADLDRWIGLGQFVCGVAPTSSDRSNSLDHDVDLADFESCDFDVEIKFLG